MDPFYHKRYRTFFCFWRTDRISDTISKTSVKSSGSIGLRIRNVNGIDIAKKMTNEEYFKSIQQEWNGPVNTGGRNQRKADGK